VDLEATMEAPCPPEALRPWVEDLDRYPSWLTIVERAEQLHDAGPQPAWRVDLRGRVGPLARSKRLRMVRTRCADGEVVFERTELDGRHHAPWVMAASVRPTPAGSHLTVRLHYGGALWGPVLERLLRDEIESATPRLLALVSS
jgi:hypothetical protein